MNDHLDFERIIDANPLKFQVNKIENFYEF